MVSYAALTDRAAVDEAIAEFDRIGRFAFLEKYGFGQATSYFLVTDNGHYDSKAIFGVAYGIQHGEVPANDEFHGGRNGAAARLDQLGYMIEGLEGQRGRLSFDTFEAALNEFKLPVENMARVHEFVVQHDFVEFYIPGSRTYIAMIARGDTRPSAWIHVGYIWYREADGTQGGIALPYNRLRDSGGGRRRRRDDSERMTCPTPGCGMLLPVSGVCDYC
ncbi:hypothetical protein AB0N64_11000 [Microbacterium sp. NPDC089318]